MTAVLLDSRVKGISAQIAVRHNKVVRVKGMAEGDLLIVHCLPGGQLSVAEDSTFPIPECADWLSVEHTEVAKDKTEGIYVDILRLKK